MKKKPEVYNKEYTINDLAKTTVKGTFTLIEYKTFKEGYFLILSKALIKYYGYKGALLLSELTRMCQTMPNIDNDKFCLISKSIIENDIGMSRDVTDPLIQMLEDDCAIETKLTHNNRKKWYRVNHQRLLAVFEKYNDRKREII